MDVDNDWEIWNEIWRALSEEELRDGSLDHALEPLIEKYGSDTVMRYVWLIHLDDLIEVHEVVANDDTGSPRLSVTELTAKGWRQVVKEGLDDRR